MIRRSDPETYVLALITQGSKSISLARRDTRVDCGDVVFFDTSHPYAAGSPRPADTTMSLVHVPRGLIALPANRLEAALGGRIDTRRGIGAVFRQLLVSLESHGGDCAPHELHLLERSVLDLASGLLARQFDIWDRLPPETREQVMLKRIDAFIDCHIAGPQLTPEAVAARHHVSLCTLHNLFQSSGETVAASIRRRRLERCQADLLDPSQSGCPVHVIAGRWDFSSPAVFSRAFRNAFGMSPRELRSCRS
ncbi:helix-turn-helix domain-containing protein [Streptomyces sp. JNUCC 64]